MNSPDLQAQIAAARAYENLFVPALFRQWAEKVVDLAQVQPGQKVLDIACGTGVVAREVAERTGASGHVAALDANPGMLAVAKELRPDIHWRQGLAGELPYPKNSFDTVVCQFGLMFFPDRQKALDEMLRVLRPGGRLVVAVWESLANTPAYAAEVEILERLAGVAAADALRAPFVLGDPKVLQNLFNQLDLTDVEIASQPGRGRFPSLSILIDADLRGWLPVMGITLSEEQIASILREAETVLKSYVQEDGSYEFEAPAILVHGKKRISS